MVLGRYLEIVIRRKWLLLTPPLLGVAGTLAVSFWLPRFSAELYESAATVRIAVAGSSLAGLTPVDRSEVERLTNTYGYLLKSPSVLTRVIATLEPSGSFEDLQRRVDLKALPNTELVEIHARAPSAQEAQALANALATGLVNEATGFYIGLNNPQLASSFSIVERAGLPKRPIWPIWPHRVGLALGIGLAAGVGLALAAEYTDRTVRSRKDLDVIATVPILASIPRLKPPLRNGPLSPNTSTTHLDLSEMRLLTAKLHGSLQKHPLKSILVTSLQPGQGTTCVAASIAIGLAREGFLVLLVDANLATPSLEKVFDLRSSDAGLTDVLTALARGPHDSPAATLERSLQSSATPGLRILTAGSRTEVVGKTLGSSEMVKLVQLWGHMAVNKDVPGACASATQQAIVIVDAPPLLSAADVLVLAAAGGVIMVCAEGEQTIDGVEQSLDQLNSLGANILGLVYNKATNTPAYAGRS